MANPFGITLDRVSAKVAAALILISQARPLDDIVAKLTPHELEQVIKLVGRCPTYYPPAALDALKGKRNLASPQPPTQKLALKPGQPGARTNPGTEHSRRIRAPRFNAPRLEVLQTSTERATATTFKRWLDPSLIEEGCRYPL